MLDNAPGRGRAGYSEQMGDQTWGLCKSCFMYVYRSGVRLERRKVDRLERRKVDRLERRKVTYTYIQVDRLERLLFICLFIYYFYLFIYIYMYVYVYYMTYD